MKRFITFAAAVLLGLVSAQTQPPVTPGAADTPGLDAQTNFVLKNTALKQAWDDKLDVGNAGSCLITSESNSFNLAALSIPVRVDIDLDGDGKDEVLEVMFCNPKLQNEQKDAKKSLVFVRDTITEDAQLKRVARLTSGSNDIVSKELLKGDDGKATGLKFSPKETSDTSPKALCKGNPWKVQFEVKCDAKELSYLSVDKFKSSKNADSCELLFSATHSAGCSVVSTAEVQEYVNKNPWIVALAMIAIGIATCFYGGKLFDYLIVAIPALIAFTFAFLILSGIMSGWVLAIVGFLLSGAAAAGVGYFAFKTKKIAMGILGGIAGFFAGYFLFSLVISLIFTSQIVLWITLIACTAAGAWAIYKYQEEMELHATVFIGAYLIIRGLSNFLGGFPEEAQLFSMLSNGTFTFGLAFYGYIALFIALNVAGTWFQHYMEFDKSMPSKKLKNDLNNGDFENAAPLANHTH